VPPRRRCAPPTDSSVVLRGSVVLRSSVVLNGSVVLRGSVAPPPPSSLTISDPSHFLQTIRHSSSYAVPAMIRCVTRLRPRSPLSWPIQDILLFRGGIPRIYNILCIYPLCLGTLPPPPVSPTLLRNLLLARPPFIAILNNIGNGNLV